MELMALEAEFEGLLIWSVIHNISDERLTGGKFIF